jgi:hypothetical protein
LGLAAHLDFAGGKAPFQLSRLLIRFALVGRNRLELAHAGLVRCNLPHG